MCSDKSKGEALMAQLDQISEKSINGRNRIDHICCLVLEEIGHADLSPYLPLKCLHQVIDNGHLIPKHLFEESNQRFINLKNIIKYSKFSNISSDFTLTTNTRTVTSMRNKYATFHENEDEYAEEVDYNERIPITLIGLSNYKMDSAKLNRGCLIIRTNMDSQALKKTTVEISEATANIIRKKQNESGEKTIDYTNYNSILKAAIEGATEGYYNQIKNDNNAPEYRISRYIGLRDLYGFVRQFTRFFYEIISHYISKNLNNDEFISEYQKCLLMIIYRNFSGYPFPTILMTKAFSKCILESMRLSMEKITNSNNILLDMISSLSINTFSIPAIDIIEDNLKVIPERNVKSPFMRHLLIYTENNSAMTLLNNEIKSKISYIFYPDNMSSYPDDEWITNEIKILANAMKVGSTVMFLGSHPMFNGLYDVFNLRYQQIRGKNFAHVSFNGDSFPTEVHHQFRAIIVVNSQVYETVLHDPFLNRFEAIHLTYDSLSDEASKIKDKIREIMPPENIRLKNINNKIHEVQFKSIMYINKLFGITDDAINPMFFLNKMPSEILYLIYLQYIKNYDSKFLSSFSNSIFVYTTGLHSTLPHLLQYYDLLSQSQDNFHQVFHDPIEKLFHNLWITKNSMKGIQTVVLVPNIEDVESINNALSHYFYGIKNLKTEFVIHLEIDKVTKAFIFQTKSNKSFSIEFKYTIKTDPLGNSKVVYSLEGNLIHFENSNQQERILIDSIEHFIVSGIVRKVNLRCFSKNIENKSNLCITIYCTGNEFAIESFISATINSSIPLKAYYQSDFLDPINSKSIYHIIRNYCYNEMNTIIFISRLYSYNSEYFTRFAHLQFELQNIREKCGLLYKPSTIHTLFLISMNDVNRSNSFHENERNDTKYLIQTPEWPIIYLDKLVNSSFIPKEDENEYNSHYLGSIDIRTLLYESLNTIFNTKIDKEFYIKSSVLKGIIQLFNQEDSGIIMKHISNELFINYLIDSFDKVITESQTLKSTLNDGENSMIFKLLPFLTNDYPDSLLEYISSNVTNKISYSLTIFIRDIFNAQKFENNFINENYIKNIIGFSSTNLKKHLAESNFFLESPHMYFIEKRYKSSNQEIDTNQCVYQEAEQLLLERKMKLKNNDMTIYSTKEPNKKINEDVKLNKIIASEAFMNSYIFGILLPNFNENITDFTKNTNLLSFMKCLVNFTSEPNDSFIDSIVQPNYTVTSKTVSY
ncbi:hypothetical protein TRFO_32866 [Tritrichomonas foetus]|uniref:Uncharacterized protein n=1 Tax=Tritrichomonas foetus TaxID=1144522 RepID=A0A1J4JP03_9EUKA|nr:hypothetical protein TRFO_32866 [Tritrichomonas foetus]|eukprot:OHT00458.1 hypothetical protein TRFO_32866 [Tritrichomonas foetus]